MTAGPGAPPDPAPEDLAGLQPHGSARRRWPAVIGALLTVAMIVGLGRQLFASGLAGLGRYVPADPQFYFYFALLYVSSPAGDFVIFRRLWGIPYGSGMIALLKKRIANDVVLGYSGEAYFYAWARARAAMVAAPFGAVKDVSILSAIAGNMATLAMMAVALPLGHALMSSSQIQMFSGSAGIVIAMSLPFLVFSKRVFSLPRRLLWWIFAIHLLRLVAWSLFVALAWHYALPDVTVGMWLLLAAGRLLVSRLPLVPNKDLLFANFAILVIGQGDAVSGLMAFTAALTLLVHVVLIVLFSLGGLAKRKFG